MLLENGGKEKKKKKTYTARSQKSGLPQTIVYGREEKGDKAVNAR
jgi:hypothetical protein